VPATTRDWLSFTVAWPFFDAEYSGVAEILSDEVNVDVTRAHILSLSTFTHAVPPVTEPRFDPVWLT
jgi:hypothetical protein